MSDAFRFRQILPNLLSNTPRFIPKDGRTILKIEIREAEFAKKAMICSTVPDNGIGMNPEYLKQVFEPFTRERDSRIDQIEGSGLGMVITKRLIDLLEDTIIVKSQLGAGTAFDTLMSMDILIDSREGQKDFRELHVLLTDDDPAQQVCASSSLRFMGMEVECTDSKGAEKRFLTHWETESFGFIISGLSLAEVERMGKTEMICRGIHGRVSLVIPAYDVSGVKERVMA